MITQQFFEKRKSRLHIAGFVNVKNEYPEFVPYQRAAYEIIKAGIEYSINKIQPLKSVYITGAIQIGKTTLMKLLADLYIDRGMRVFYTDTETYIENTKVKTNRIEKEESEAYLRLCKTVNVLFIDNISWCIDTDYEFKKIVSLFRHRYDNKFATVTSSNIVFKNIKNPNQYEAQMQAYFKNDYYEQIEFKSKKALNSNSAVAIFDPETTVLNELKLSLEQTERPDNGGKKVTRQFAYRAAVLVMMRLDHLVTDAEIDEGIDIIYERLERDKRMNFNADQKHKVNELNKLLYPKKIKTG